MDNSSQIGPLQMITIALYIVPENLLDLTFKSLTSPQNNLMGHYHDHFGDLQNNLLLVDIVVVIEGIVDVGIVVADGIVKDGRSCWWNRCFRNI